MANGRRHGIRGTQFGPTRPRARAIDLDPIASGLHQGAQPKRCIFDAVHMAAIDQTHQPNNALATREPSTHGPRTMASGMVECFNGRIEDVLQSHHFRSGEDLEQTILRYVRLYNGQLPQSVLKGQVPLDAMKDWHRERPELFKKKPYPHPGRDRQAKRKGPAKVGTNTEAGR